MIIGRLSSLSFAVLLTCTAALVAAQQNPPPPRQQQPPADDRPRRPSPDQDADAKRQQQIEQVSPVRRIERKPGRRKSEGGHKPGIRSIDGSGNNEAQPEMNAHGEPLRRKMYAYYADEVAGMSGDDRAGPREISNIVAAQEALVFNDRDATDFLWQWGQFLDHDIDLTDGADPAEAANIYIPAGDAWFDPAALGTRELPFNRSLYDHTSGTSPDNPRQQLNEITGWIDGSNVYGSDEERALALRANDGSGRLKTSPGDLLPYNSEGLANAGGTSETLFLAGDVRANEQVGLTAMHTLFMREHNRLADQIRDRDPQLSGDDIYQRARAIVGAQMQVITYREFLPLLLGHDAIPPYQGYDPEVDARIMNSFSTAAYRLGHSLLSPDLMRLNEDMQEIPAGHLPLRSAFFAPREIELEGIEPLLRGLSAQLCQELDVMVVDDIRNFLFGDPDNNGFDLASLNVQRGRDHGLPGYNAAREHMGLQPVVFFDQISSDPQVQERLQVAYGDVDAVDLWVGGLAEDHLPDSMLGELFFTILVEQFAALRDGDRFWYTRQFSGDTLRDLERTRLSDVIRRNTTIGEELPDDVFRLQAGGRHPGGRHPGGRHPGGRHPGDQSPGPG